MGTDENPAAARLEAVLRLLFAAETDEEFAQAQQQARRIAQMSDDEVAKLHGGEAGGDFVQHLRQGEPLAY